ncbi:Panacea domain-containing protein [Variovorax sp. PBL-E5]|uniref:Panacea domain-containing protein n=1 Tax=Variovorax sp. PBL-E5 TaxID=434014 RepID=UPI0013182604|nr:type II toxin-antitoxin system antitoxin SocA domain-containing protein [Variovorax sp. PBL-E5]VTU36172.1 putative phage-associated protein [Variovorax sp. PBL-E5]
MTYSPRIIANAFLRKAKEQNTGLSHMKLQKLVFYAHAWNLALHGEPLLSEKVEAWTYGPVVDSLYHELKAHGSNDIKSYLKEEDRKTGALVAYVPNSSDTQTWKLIDQVWDRYSKYSASQLSAMTHTNGSPWHQARLEDDRKISNDAIREYYSKTARVGLARG